MRAPEALFKLPISGFVDMWSVGCLVSYVTIIYHHKLNQERYSFLRL